MAKMDPMETRQSMLELPSRGSNVTIYFPCLSVSTSISFSFSWKWKFSLYLWSETRNAYLRDEKTGRVGRAKHVDEEVIGKHIKLLHFFTLQDKEYFRKSITPKNFENRHLKNIWQISHLHVGVPGSAKELGDTSPPHLFENLDQLLNIKQLDRLLNMFNIYLHI